MGKHNPLLGYRGLYQFQKQRILERDSEGNPTRLSEPEVVLPWFDNLITDAGLDMLAETSSDVLSFCRLGTGNTPPSFADTGLVAQVASTSTNGVGSASGYAADDSYIYRRVAKQFAAGSAAGVNLAEVAMAPQASGGNVFSRALLQDEAGNPITINLLEDEVLTVLYELRLYANLTPVVTEEMIDGVPTEVTVQAIGWHENTGPGNPDAWLPARLGIRGIINNDSPFSGTRLFKVLEDFSTTPVNQGDSPVSGTLSLGAYTNGTFRRTITCSLSTSEGNFATGIGCVKYNTTRTSNLTGSGSNSNGIGQFAVGFNPKIQKDSTKTAQITVGISWGRYTPPEE